MNNRVFLDTSFAIALSVDSDSYHDRASEIAEQLLAANTRLVTTRAIVFEIGNALSKIRYRSAAVKLLTALESDPNVEIIPMSDPLHKKAFELFSTRADKEWGLVDCLSFVVMNDGRIHEALTADEHFEQAGFVRLLKATQ